MWLVEKIRPVALSMGDGDIEERAFVKTSKISIKDVPNCARELWKILHNCKEIVKYVKLVSKRKDPISTDSSVFRMD